MFDNSLAQQYRALTKKGVYFAYAQLHQEIQNMTPMEKHRNWIQCFVRIAIGSVASNSAEATVLSGQIEGSCQIVSPEECKITFFSHIRHDPATPVVAHRVLANDRVIYDGKNDASNPVSNTPGRFLRGFTGDIAARCGRRYTLELLAMASDDTGLRSLTKTGPFRCPSRVP